MDRKDDEENPPGCSDSKHKRKHRHSPDMMRKKKKTGALKLSDPPENLVPDINSALPAAGASGSDADKRSAPTDCDDDSTDSDCAMDQPTLLEQLKTILDNYQDAQIIRELVQNADDANASEMKIVYVNDGAGATQQNNCYSDYFRAPALCVYNNALFSKQDWKYIKSIYNSGKREDTLKVGRFGLGFKSVFHITDNPVIISNDRAMVIDPFRKKKGLGNDCQVLTFKKLRKHHKEHHKQAVAAMKSVYGYFGFTHKSLEDNYSGSIFWFALRRFPSELSTRVLDHSDVTELISMFKKEAACLPLFLKNISLVSFHDQEEASVSFSLKCDVLEKEEKKSFNAKLKACNGVSPDDSMKAIFRVVISLQDGKHSNEQNWVVCNYIKGLGDLSEELRALADDKQLSYSPFVGLATPVDNTTEKQLHGQVFCFLPLPNTSENQTGLPVHVNGFFALSQDRHHVKWPEDDQIERLDPAQRWNHLLCEEVLVEAYVDTVEYVKNLTVNDKCTECDNKIVYNILPSKTNIRPNWDAIYNPVCRRLEDKAIFYTENGDKWIKAHDAIFSILQGIEDILEPNIIRQTEQCIFKLLLKYKRNVVRIPSHVEEMFPDVTRITPRFLRNVIREDNIYRRLPVKQQILLLQFILADRQYGDLKDLALLPLEDDSFRTFESEPSVYLCAASEVKMFPGTERNFIKLDLPQQIRDQLKEMQTKGFCKLRTLNAEGFLNLYSQTLAANGTTRTNGCFISSPSHLSMQWLDNVWSYIGQKMYHELEDFEKLNLVPVSDTSVSGEVLELMPLKGLYLVTDCDGMTSLEQNLCNALEKLPIHVIGHIAKGETHSYLLGTYCKYPNIEGVLELLESVCKNCKTQQLRVSLEEMVQQFNDKCNMEEKIAVLNFLSKDCQHSSSSADFLIKELAIFPETTNENKAITYVSVTKNGHIACENNIPVKYSVPYLHLDDKQRILAKRLGAKEISETTIVENILQAMTNTPDIYKRSSIELFMMYVLKYCTSLSSSRDDLSVITDLGSRIKFIGTSHTAELAPIGAFFDHTNRGLQELFHFDDSKFLSETYRNEELETVLRKFGLKSDKDVKEDDVLAVVQALDRECRKREQPQVKEIRICSLKVMETLEKMEREATVNLDLKEYRWISVIDKKPVYYPDILPWYAEQYGHSLCTLLDVSSSKHATQAASVKCILETSSCPCLANKYGWDNPPDAGICLRQLEAVRNVFCIKHKAKLNGILKDIYQQLFDHINSMDHELELQPIVCTGETFNLPRDVFISFPADENIHLEPYMYKLPVEFAEFSELFVKLGSIQELNINSLKFILTTIKKSTKISTVEKDRRIVVRILKMISSLRNEHDILSDVLVPVQSIDANLILQPVKDCTYSDEDSCWLQTEGDDDVNYVHPYVGGVLAESLGVLSFTQRFLSDGGTEEMISACGQSEPLTTRLKHLLENYPDGLAVLKELVQNADDAGAQQIRFLYDERQNKDATVGLIDVNMAKCQGPAFWAFNDAMFTEHDFENIVKLGGETKKAMRTKIGKFGLGFCAVYNITDVPSFVSGNSLVIFDPHTTHLGKAIKNKNSPGIRLTISEKSSGMLKRMRNQFMPYNKIFGCDLSGDGKHQNFEGTLFRFPLRTKQQAVDGEIRNTPYCKDEVIKLLHLLMNCAGDLLTFTQNLKDIELFHLQEDSVNPPNDMQLMFSTKKEMLKIHHTFTNLANINVMTEAENVLRTKQPFTKTEMISLTLHTSKNDLLKVEETYLKSPWLVCWASGTKQDVLEKAVLLQNDGALPLGSVAVCLKDMDSSFVAVPFPHKEKLHGSYDKSHVFCFLPLPVECTLPVHINGCFAVSSDRKGLIKCTSDEKNESENEVWNRMLLSDAVCHANISLLMSLEHFEVGLDETYSTLWPLSVEQPEEASCLSDAFCKAVINAGNRVFYTPQGRRASFLESIFLDNSLRHDNVVGEYAFEIFTNLYNDERVPMDMPQALYHRFCLANCEKDLLHQTMTMEDFYKEIVFPHIQQINEEKRDALVMHILKSNDDSLQELLKSNPCIPVRPDGTCILKHPRDLVRPQTELSKLFGKEDGRFPDDKYQPFCGEVNLNILVQLGMMDRTLPDQLVVERAQSISKLPKIKRAFHRCQRLLAYLVREQDSCQVDVKNDLSTIAFLPVLQKPCDWPLTWFSTSDNTGMFASPNQMFFPECMERVACSQLIVNVEELKNEFEVLTILKQLGVKQEGLHGDVERQLFAIGEIGEHLPDKQKLRLQNICISVYEYLDRSTENLTGTYDDLPILWISDQLISPHRATLETFSRIDCTPEIYQIVSRDLSRYENFLERVGVKKCLPMENVIVALERMKIDHDKPLEEEKIRLIVNLLELLAAVCSRRCHTLNSDEKSRILVPDDTNILRSLDELCVDDGYPMPRQKYMYFVNSKVSGEINKLLDIKSKRIKHLNTIKGSMPFGQKEELVTRLKGILDEYPADETILYELLQNADDAGATKIMFIEDKRHHETKKGLFSESWSDIQGPALCVFNDSCFSDADLQGICRLGKGSKSQDPTKTGQFGIGFNAVYHLTDAPSFVTRGPSTPNQGTFCAFDPHCAFCPSADDLNPGLQLPDLKVLEETYPGVYECYLQEELPETQGTLFRLPLRTLKMAEISQVCKKTFGAKLLRRLLFQFKQNMKKSLLFLRNVRQISLCEIDDHGKMKEKHKVMSTLEEHDEHKLKSFFAECDNLTKELFAGSKNMFDIPKQTIQYMMTINEYSRQPTRWIVAQTFGLEDGTKVRDILKEDLECKDINLTPKGAVALPCSQEDIDRGHAYTQQETSKHYNYPFSLSHNHERNLSIEHKSLHDRFGPSLSNTSRDRTDLGSEGQVFCFLPLPLKTGLPVHINGHFALHQTRGSMWDTESSRGYWNSLLLETTISNSYVLAIEYLRQTSPGNTVGSKDIRNFLKMYHDSFPRYSQVKTDLIKNMVSSFFVMLYHRESTVFPVLSPIKKPIWWVGLKQKEHTFHAFFNNLPEEFRAEVEMTLDQQRRNQYGLQIDDEEETRLLQQAESNAQQLSIILRNIGMKILESPLWINDSIKEAFQNQGNMRIHCAMTPSISYDNKHMLDHTFVIQFLRTEDKTTSDACLVKDVNCNVRDTPFVNIENTLCLLRYCLKDTKLFIKNMEQLPLLVTNDGMLRRFSTTSLVFLSEFCDLLPKSSKEFVHRKMVNVLQRLQLPNQFLKCFDLNSFARLLPDNVDMTSVTEYEPIPWNQNILTFKWMQEFWRFVDTLQQKDIRRLGNWCLIPGEEKGTSTGQTEILVPCNKDFVLMNVDSFKNDVTPPIHSVLASLQMPSQHSRICSKTTLRRVVASKNDPVRFVECLHYHKNKIKCLRPNQCTTVLRYLTDNITELFRTEPLVLDKLKNLPLFTTVYGTCVQLKGNVQIHIVENSRDLPTDGLESWSNSCNIALLKHNPYTTALMEYLNYNRTISITSLYCELILPKFHFLDQEHHLCHLRYVRSILKDDPSCPLKSALQETEFISLEGLFKRASHFFNPHNKLCAKLCDQSMLPPDPFGDVEWKNFMIHAGMKTTVTVDLYCKFARQIEQSVLKNGMTEEILEQSREMITYLFDTPELLNDENLLKSIKNVKFVEPYRVQQKFRNIYPQFGCETLIAFCGSAPRSLAPVVWTTISILPDYSCHEDPHIQEKLGILRTPPVCDVLSHTHNVCDTLNKNKIVYERNSEEDIQTLMTDIYRYLQKKCIQTSETKTMLSETPLVHLKEKGLFVTARQVSITFSGKKQIPPYLVKIPLNYGPFEDLFKFVGTTESVTLGQYSDVLYRIHAEVKSAILGPEQLQDVLSALTGLLLLLEEASVSNNEEPMELVETLYLPASDKTLAKSTDLVYADKQKLKKRVIRGNDHGIAFLHSLKDCHKSEDLILKLPKRLRPKVLSAIIQEHLISYSNYEMDQKVEDLKGFLASQRFLNALKKLGKFENFDCYSQRLLSICFVSPSEIKTILHLDGKPIFGTECTPEYFYSEGERKCYIAASTHAVRIWLKKIGQQLCGMLSDCVDKRISPEKFRELVDYVDDPTGFKSYCEEFLDEEENDDDSLSYHPGQIVPVGLHALLQNDITLLKVGEIVAYELFDPAIDNDNDDVVSGNATSDVVYVFVRIVQEQPLAGPNSCHQKYKVNFGQDSEKIVLGLRLYRVVYPGSSETTEVVLHQFGNDGSIPRSKDGIFDQIIITLSNAWNLNDGDRKRVIKRLLLVWHPDKNRNRGKEYETFCKEVTQFIFDIIRRLENGERFDTESPNESDGGNFHNWHYESDGNNRRRRRRRNYDNWQYGGGCSRFWQSFGDRMSSRHTQNESNYCHFYKQRKVYVPDPQPAEAHRWFRQAGMDYSSGRDSLEAINSSDCDNKTKEDFNWICFKFHQACEKACKAYMYSIDAKKLTKYHYLPNILPYGDELQKKLREIESLVGSYSRMRYPDVMEFPSIPGTLYTKDQADTLMALAEKVMEAIQTRL